MFMKLFEDKIEKDGTQSLSRWIAFLTWIILSIGFTITAYNVKLPKWELYIAYPVGTMIAFVPQVVMRMVKEVKDIIIAIKGGNN